MIAVRLALVVAATFAVFMPLTASAFRLPQVPPIRPWVDVPAILDGTESQTGEYRTVDISQLGLGPNQHATWGLVNEALVPDGGTSGYAPFDTMIFYVNGEKKELFAYANVVDGVFDANGPHQCTALVAQYISELGLTVKAPFGDGMEVAANLADHYPGSFEYSVGEDAPVLGSVVSIANPDGIGHVAVIKGLEAGIVDNKQAFTATLIEQNTTTKQERSYNINNTIVFTKDPRTGLWSGAYRLRPNIDPQLGLSWANPK